MDFKDYTGIADVPIMDGDDVTPAVPIIDREDRTPHVPIIDEDDRAPYVKALEYLQWVLARNPKLAQSLAGGKNRGPDEWELIQLLQEEKERQTNKQKGELL